MAEATLEDSSIWIRRTTDFVQEHMKQYDASHDMAHVERVLRLALYVAEAEEKGDLTGKGYDRTVVTLAALLHDVCDHKYVAASSEAEAEISELLLSFGVPADLAGRVQVIISNVSYSQECKHPDSVRQALLRYPELGFVQDADRLDALGAIGVGRCLTYGATKAASKGKVSESHNCMDDAIAHFGDKLFRLEGTMKTETGRRLARVRTKKLKLFEKWWRAEMTGQFECEEGGEDAEHLEDFAVAL